MARGKVVIDFTPMNAAMSRAALAIQKMNQSLSLSFGSGAQYQRALIVMLDAQALEARNRRRGHLVGLALAFVLSYVVVIWMVANDITNPVLVAAMSLATGWFILKDLYHATKWENRLHEIEETREAMGI